MNFTTKVPVTKSESPIDYHSVILSLGSCFAENMGEKFDYFKFRNITNPFGIIFNPVSIEKLVDRAVNQRFFTEKDVFFHQDLWHCFEVHSTLSHPDKEAFLQILNDLVKSTQALIIQSTHIIITYGTAWVYQNKNSTEIVANCHKVPQKEFAKELLSLEVIEQSIANTIALLQKANPKAKFIFTISPVRHTKDGFVENQLSKAHLIAGLHHAISNVSEAKYFPSYEIVMDELRDYRFYAEDMLHPNPTAVDYIWNRFFENFVSADCYSIMEEVNSIQKSLAHRPFNPDTKSHQQFLEAVNQKILRLKTQFSHFEF